MHDQRIVGIGAHAIRNIGADVEQRIPAELSDYGLAQVCCLVEQHAGMPHALLPEINGREAMDCDQHVAPAVGAALFEMRAQAILKRMKYQAVTTVLLRGTPAKGCRECPSPQNACGMLSATCSGRFKSISSLE